jgi:two-component system, OmpR family, sensor histidine kinase MtrB
MSTTQTVEAEPVDLARLLAQILEQQGSDPVVLSGDTAVVHTDARHLERVLDNVVRNAQTHGEGLTSVSVESSADGVTITFDDAGPGIDEDLVHRMFEPFVRGEQADPNSGAGLGMAIAAEHAKAINAELAVEARQPGTRVVVRLPQEIGS